MTRLRLRIPYYSVLKHAFRKRVLICIAVIIAGAGIVGIFLTGYGRYNMLDVQKQQMQLEVHTLQSELDAVRNEDQYVKNAQLQETIGHIQKTYGAAVTAYESLLDLGDTADEDMQTLFAGILSDLSREKWASASSAVTALSKAVTEAKSKAASSFVIPKNVVQDNTPPGAGYSRQSVDSDVGTFLVDIVAADMGTTRIIVDTASDKDCSNDCPVKSLSEYVSANGAFAGINGSYFCPASYPSCADKKNSFDTLLMNKNKTYFNSENNVYSTVPAVIFLSGSMRFVGRSLEWGRDTGADSVIANQPLLVSGGTVVFGGDGDPKKGSRGNRSFVGNKGTTAYIGVVHNATVAEVAHVLATLGLENALNLDSGGSTALWSGGYKAGPGRNIPNAILFVRK